MGSDLFEVCGTPKLEWLRACLTNCMIPIMERMLVKIYIQRTSEGRTAKLHSQRRQRKCLRIVTLFLTADNTYTYRKKKVHKYVYMVSSVKKWSKFYNAPIPSKANLHLVSVSGGFLASIYLLYIKIRNPKEHAYRRVLRLLMQDKDLMKMFSILGTYGRLFRLPRYGNTLPR